MSELPPGFVDWANARWKIELNQDRKTTLSEVTTDNGNGNGHIEPEGEEQVCYTCEALRCVESAKESDVASAELLLAEAAVYTGLLNAGRLSAIENAIFAVAMELDRNNDLLAATTKESA